MADTDKRLQMFGKTFAVVGDDKTNLCLYTAGDVKIKTPNRFVTIFKNGKLAVDDSTEIFAVSSVDDIDKTGVYLVTDPETGEQSVYLEVDGNRMLLAYSGDGFISYTAVQNLTADQFLQALENIGFYFDTLDDAKASGITEGLVYVLGTNTLYKCVNGEFIDLEQEIVNLAVSQMKEETTIPTYDTLQVGGIFIDGINNNITASELTLQVNGNDYIILRGNTIYVRKDVVLGKDVDVSTEGAEKGKSGLLIYTDDDGVTLEIDNLIVHNQSLSYEPSLYAAYIGSETTNLIESASWNEAPYSIELTLKYDNQFSEGDHVVIQTAGGNAVTVNFWKDEDTGEWNVDAHTESLLSADSVIRVTYTYWESEEAEEETVGNVYISLANLEDDEEDPDEYAYGTASLDVPTEAYDFEVTSLTVVSGDSDLYWDEGGNHDSRVIYYGIVTSVDPLVVEVPNQTNLSSSVLQNLQWSPIYKVASESGSQYVLWGEGQNLSLMRHDADDGALLRSVEVRIGSLDGITDEQIGELTGEGLYSKFLYVSNADIGVETVFQSIVSEETVQRETVEELIVDGPALPVYGEGLDMPGDFTEDTYDKVIPDVAWVKALIRDALTTYFP